MTTLEREVFSRIILEIWEAKVAPTAALGVPPTDEV